MTLNIRLADKEDIPTIQHLAQAIWPDTFGDILSKEQIAYMLDMMYGPSALSDQMHRPGLQFFLVELDDTAVGFMSLEMMGQWVKMHKLYVLPEKQGLGIGKRLILRAKEWAIEQAASRINLNVNRFNTAAIAFYKAQGFSILKEEDIDIGEGYWMNDYQMQLNFE